VGSLSLCGIYSGCALYAPKERAHAASIPLLLGWGNVYGALGAYAFVEKKSMASLQIKINFKIKILN
jgi:hypothetical protein